MIDALLILILIVSYAAVLWRKRKNLHLETETGQPQVRKLAE